MSKTILGKTALLAAVTLAASLGVAQAQNKTLVYCSEGSPENFNPMINTTGTSLQASRPIYNGLTTFVNGTTAVGPALAEKWEVSADGLTYTFHLRHNAKWHSNKNFKPTRGFNADDVVFSFDRQGNPANPYHKVTGGGYDYWADMGMPKFLKSVTKVDDFTVKFTLNVPQAPFIANIAMPFASIQSKEYADVLLKMGKPELIDQDPIGTGPYEFVQYIKDATIRYKRFDGYYGPKAKIPNLVYSINKDAAVRLAKLRANECQISPFPSPADLPSIRADKNLQLLSQPGLNIGYLAFNVLKKPFDDVRVRMAINMAVDKKAILAAVYQGAGQTAKNLIPPTMWSYNDKVEDFKYDPAAAKKLLAEAGFPDGFETDLWAMPVQRPYNPDAKRIGELMQADLAKIGVKAKIVSYEWGEYRKRVQAGDHMMAQLGWSGDNGDPDNFFAVLASCVAAKGGSATKWCNKDYDDLITKAATISNVAERTKLYEQAQIVMHKDAPYLFIAHSVVFWPLRANVTGFKISAVGGYDFSEIDLK